MNIEKHNSKSKIMNWNEALDFVYQHRNIFSDSIRKYRYDIISGAYIVKEVERFNDVINRWYWCFYKDKFMIIKNPSEKDNIAKVVSNWVKEIKDDKN